MKLTNFANALSAEIKRSLPGLDTQLRMAPPTRKKELAKRKLLNRIIKPRLSAVLVLFYEKDGEIFIPFIKRPEYNGVHSKQIAFPGGRVEEEDKDMIATALREANEEIGIIADDVSILGALSELYIPPSNYNVLPVLAYTTNIPNFIPEEKEVDKVVEVKLNDLLNPTNKQVKKINTGKHLNIKVPCYYVEDEIIWGATAMMLNELLEIIQKFYSATSME